MDDLEVCRDYDLDGLTVAVQGYGSVGANAARLLDDWGADVVALGSIAEAKSVRGLWP